MSGEQRREQIVNLLKSQTNPINATDLAKTFSVTRQIIVADVALLRASGYKIRAEHKGYVIEKEISTGLLKQIVVKHGKEEVKEEFYAIVDNGGRVLDVIVEHKMYGTISVKLDISTRFDADNFVSEINKAGISPLSALTEGLHIHTISVTDNACFERIVARLKQLKIFIEST